VNIGTGTIRPCRLCLVKYAGNQDTKKSIVPTYENWVFSLYWFILVLRCPQKNVSLFVNAINTKFAPDALEFSRLRASKASTILRQLGWQGVVEIRSGSKPAAISC
jgi:hypothetical protein